MNAFELARRYGVRVELADLGTWGGSELRAEYDPSGPAIRINLRVLARTPAAEMPGFLAMAIAHELYHHREALREVPRLHSRAQRERAADEFALELLRG